MQSYERILVPLDFSAPALEAARRALGLARCLESSVEFLHVVDNRQVEMVPVHMVAAADPQESKLQAAAMQRLQEFVRELDTTGVQTELRVRLGVPFHEILEHIQETGPSLIVMGTHGRTGLARAVLGSQSEMVVRRSPVPVLVVHAAGEPGEEETP